MEFKSQAELQAYLNSQKPGALICKECTIVFAVTDLRREKYPTWFMVQQFIKVGVPIRIAFDAPTAGVDLTEDDIILPGMQVKTEDIALNTYVVHLKWN